MNLIVRGPFVIAEGVLGIPKKELNVVFRSAVREFDRVIAGTDDVESPSSSSSKEGKDNNRRLLDLSTLVQLVTFENLTAINVRKRFILSAPTNFLRQARIKDDFRWLDILFTSPLHKHTKSPMLWQHRKWLYITLIDDNGPTKNMPNVMDEIRLVLKAGELHPKNYYAWSYARWLVLNYTTPTEMTRTSQDGVALILPTVFEFCKSHVSDISAWSYLDFLLDYQTSIDVRLKYQREVIEFSKIVPGHEAVWIFLRVTAASMLANEKDSRGYELLQSMYPETGAVVAASNKLDFRYWKESIEWIDKTSVGRP